VPARRADGIGCQVDYAPLMAAFIVAAATLSVRHHRTWCHGYRAALTPVAGVYIFRRCGLSVRRCWRWEFAAHHCHSVSEALSFEKGLSHSFRADFIGIFSALNFNRARLSL